MVFFGHIGITVGVAHLYNQRKLSKQFIEGAFPAHSSPIEGAFPAHSSLIDLRLAGFLAIAPDLVDKPIGLIFHETFGRHTRLYAHSLLFSFLVLIAFYLYRKRLVHPVILWLTFFGHMILDRAWIFSREYFYWPLLGLPAPLTRSVVLGWMMGAITPYNLFGEVIGLAILWAVRREQMLDPFLNKKYLR